MIHHCLGARLPRVVLHLYSATPTRAGFTLAERALVRENVKVTSMYKWNTRIAAKSAPWRKPPARKTTARRDLADTKSTSIPASSTTRIDGTNRIQEPV